MLIRIIKQESYTTPDRSVILVRLGGEFWDSPKQRVRDRWRIFDSETLDEGHQAESAGAVNKV